MQMSLLSPPSPSAINGSRRAPTRIAIGIGTKEDDEEIYRMRHAVYAQELGQHAANPLGRLSDALDEWNLYLVAKVGGRLAGFISITPPGAPSYSIDKYLARECLPFAFDATLYE